MREAYNVEQVGFRICRASARPTALRLSLGQAAHPWSASHQPCLKVGVAPHLGGWFSD